MSTEEAGSMRNTNHSTRTRVRHLLFVAFMAFGSVAQTVAATATDTNEANPVSLKGYTKIELLPFDNRTRSFERSADTLSQYLDAAIRPMLKRWNSETGNREAKRLTIQPDVKDKRTSFDGLASVTLILTLRDITNNEILDAPEFTEKGNPAAGFFGGERKESVMLQNLARRAAEYLNKGYELGEAELAKEHADSFAILLEAANRGESVAQTTLGKMYSDGENVDRDDNEAVAWWQKAAALGNAAAQLNMAWAYSNGRGVPNDDAEAANWLKKAAAQGDVRAYLRLADLYETGRGVTKSEKDALTNYRKAADLGDRSAKVYVARRERASRHFASFEDARAALDPEGIAAFQLSANPMSYRDRLFIVPLEIVQVLGKGGLLLGGRLLGMPEYDGKVFFAYPADGYSIPADLVDGQQTAVIGEVTGTYQYLTTNGSAKTVPKIRVYGLRTGLY